MYFKSKPGQYVVLSVGTFSVLASAMISQGACYEKSVVPVSFYFYKLSCVLLLNCDNIYGPMSCHLIIMLMI